MSKYRQIAEDIFESAPDWHGTEDLVDIVEAAIENVAEAQKQAYISAVETMKANITKAYVASQHIDSHASLAHFWMVHALERVINAILGL